MSTSTSIEMTVYRQGQVNPYAAPIAARANTGLVSRLRAVINREFPIVAQIIDRLSGRTPQQQMARAIARLQERVR